MITRNYIIEEAILKIVRQPGNLINEIEEDDSEDEGIEDYKIGGYHPIHVG